MGGLIELEDGDEKGPIKKAKEKAKEFWEKLQNKVNKAKAKKEELQEKFNVAKAKFEAAKEIGGEFLAQAQATMEQLKGQFDEAKAAWEEATADLDNAGLIELEDGDEKGPIKKLLKKLQEKANKAKAKKEKLQEQFKVAKAKFEAAKEIGGEFLAQAQAAMEQ